MAEPIEVNDNSLDTWSTRLSAKKKPRIRIPSMIVRTGRKMSDKRGFEVQLGRNARVGQLIIFRKSFQQR